MAKQKSQGSSSKKNATNDGSAKKSKGRPRKIDLGNTQKSPKSGSPGTPKPKPKPKVSKSVSPRPKTRKSTPKREGKKKVVPMSEPSTRPRRSTAGKTNAHGSSTSRPIIQEAMDTTDMNHSGSSNAGWFKSCSIM